MMISCNCLNFNATSPQLQRSLSSGAGSGGAGNANSNNNNNHNNNNSSAGAGEAALPALLLQRFVQNLPRDFIYHSIFMDFFKHAYGPIPDLTINAINQRDLIYSLTLNVAGHCWQLCLCINCKVVLCAKRLTAGAGATPTLYLINSQLLCSNEQLAIRRSHKSYSEAFELLIMDNDDAAPVGGATSVVTLPPPTPTALSTGIVSSSSNLSIGSMSTQAPLDGRLQRMRQLQAHQQARLQSEINETNERIERYTEQQFALLKSFREKCDQEGALLARQIQQIPEQACELLDRAMPVALEVTGGGSGYIGYAGGPGGRRRNTISSRRELGMPTTPTTPLLQPPSFLPLTQDASSLQQQQQQQQPLPSATILTTRKMSNFDTPPATPEATPMSVGNSPTFRQQQQQASAVANNTLLLAKPSAAAATSAEDADDCLFDLEDVDGVTQTSPIYQQQQQQHYQRLHQQQQHQLHQQHEDNMSDADEAEDALDLDSSLPIAMRGVGADGRGISAQLLYANIARSLPVEIANSPLAERANNNNNQQHVLLEDEEVLDNTVDIAASIKALAKSVHGEAVFGDLPRPRLRSQI
ncbi:uncharacterized protein PRAS40 [Drosophila montana]|uniref:uncharacterized protein PRAS40 n=1 Tax=Drosophila montana TaxID=40370 RepID=UPI00313B9728